ncbi:E3 ubiquitin-protein ligase TRIM45-like [Antedon mediterranea]|uniref:E3 ubiquitin-protein ligase TRIM45-like n=1 Tax=Antedon mediterranea TaxID=105859 RepID=UPI003AF8560A
MAMMDQKIEECQLIHCSSCQVEYDQTDDSPKYLACFHSFCNECIEKSATDKNTYKCPLSSCGKHQEVPPEGVNGLPENKLPQILTKINNLVNDMSKCQKCDGTHKADFWCKDCSMFYCKDCSEEHGTNEEHEVISCGNLAKKIENGERNVLNGSHYCSKHGEKIQSFCKKRSCKKAICKSCVEVHSPAHGHDVVDLKREADQCRKEFQCGIRDMKVCSKQWTSLEKNKSKEIEQIEMTTNEATEKIQKFFESGYILLKEREQAALKEVSKYAKEMKDYVEFQNQKASQLKESAKQLETVASNVIMYTDDKDIVQMKSRMVNVMNHLSVPPLSSRVIGPNMMSFNKADNAEERVLGFLNGIGQVKFNCAVPYLSYCEDTVAFEDFPCKINVQMVDYMGENCKQGGMNLTVVVKAPKTSTDVPHRVYDMMNGSYEVKFDPKDPGIYVAHVMLDGLHVKNSPLSIPTCELKTTVHPQVCNKPSKVTLTAVDSSRKARPMQPNLPIQAELDCPNGETITCDVVQESSKIYNIRYIPTELGEHKLYVGMNKKVLDFNPIILNVKQYLAVGQTNCSNQLNRPSAIAIDSIGNIYVSDTSKNKRIQKYNMAHECIGSIEMDLDGDASLVIDQDDNLIILFRSSKTVKVFDSTGNLQSTFTMDIMKKPIGLEVDSNNRIYITDCVGHKVYILDYYGKILNEFGGRGKEPGQFDTPVDVCLYNDLIYVCDRYNNRVQQLNEEGECLKIFNCCEKSFDMAAAITMTHEGHLVVYDAEQTMAAVLDVESKEVIKVVPCYGDVGQYQWESIIVNKDSMLLKVCPSQNCFRVYRM